MKKRKRRETVKQSWDYLVNSCVILMLCASCHDMVADGINQAEYSERQFMLAPISVTSNELTDVNCYMFNKGVFWKAYHNLNVADDGKVKLDIPANSELFFLTNIPEPTQIAKMQAGITTLEEFLSYRTSLDDIHFPTKAPLEFYTGKVIPGISDSTPEVTLGVNLARIDIDLSEASGIQIERIYTHSAARTTSYFQNDNALQSVGKCSYTHTFTVPLTDNVTDIFRLYESPSSVMFSIEGKWKDSPISMSVTIRKVERNKVYKLKIQSTGEGLTGKIVAEDWKIGEQITASDEAGSVIKIASDYSYIPAGVDIDANETTVTVPYQGVKDLTLAFLTNDELNLEHVEGVVSYLSPAEITQEKGKVLTKYQIELPANTSNLLSCVTLNFKSRNKDEVIVGKVTLNINPYPYRVSEVTIGKMTWMAFNTQTSKELSDQIFPEINGYSDVHDMYQRNWLETLGSMYQFGRMHAYLPWESGINNAGSQTEELSWSEAIHTPCPEGYRLPTRTELSNLLSGEFGSTIGGGLIPGKWTCNGDIITAQIRVATNPAVHINGIRGTARYLELKNQEGAVIYFPFGGMKEKGSPSAKDPGLGNSLCLWSSESVGSNKAYVYKLTYIEDDPYQIPDSELQLDKEAYAYIRCVKTVF